MTSPSFTRFLRANGLTPGRFYGLPDSFRVEIHQEWLRTRDRDRMLGIWPAFLAVIILFSVLTIFGQVRAIVADTETLRTEVGR